VLLPGGGVCFVEIKTTGKKPTPRQEVVMKDLCLLGFPVFIVDDAGSLANVLALCEGGDAA
jgi:hypothetical protein